MQGKQFTLIGVSIVLACTFTACSSDKHSDAPAPTQQEQQNQNIAQSYVLIDVRTNEEYAKDGLQPAKLIPYDAIADSVESIVVDKNTPIKLYCRSGRRASIAMETLTKRGYTDVENLKTVDKAQAYVEQNPMN